MAIGIYANQKTLPKLEQQIYDQTLPNKMVEVGEKISANQALPPPGNPSTANVEVSVTAPSLCREHLWYRHSAL